MADLKQQCIECELRSDSFSVRDTLADLRKTWTCWNIDDDTCDTAEMVVAEVLNNIVEHAYLERPGGRIILKNENQADGMFFAVRDNGRPMPELELPKGVLKDIPDTLDALPEGGFGWFLIRTRTKELTYHRLDNWNVLHFLI